MNILRAASLGSNFTVSYKKRVHPVTNMNWWDQVKILSQCCTQTYLHTVELVWAPKKLTQFLNQFNKLCLVVWDQKAAKQSQNFCWSVCLMVRSPILPLKSRPRHMYRYAQKNAGCSTAPTWLISKLCLFGCFLKKLNLPQIQKVQCKCFHAHQPCKNFRHPICTAVFVPPSDVSSQHKC